MSPALARQVLDRLTDLPIDPKMLEFVLRALGLELPDHRSMDRLLTTEEANAFLGKRKGFLEKRRCSGIDSPKYIQARPRGAVTYRTSDLLVWENEHIRTCTSE